MRRIHVFAVLIAIAIVVEAILLLQLERNRPERLHLVEEPAKKEEPVLVLVADKTLYKGIAITSADVRIREMRQDEAEIYQKNKDKLMPPMVSAAQLKIPTSKIQADTLLLRENFQEELPEPCCGGIREAMRAVNVSLPKERSAGGTIQVGDYVDVFLTLFTEDPQTPKTNITRTAMIDSGCRVVMKRLPITVDIERTDPQTSFTLAANPYRAALIDFAQHKGLITLVPVKNNWFQSDEGMDEKARINAVRNGDLQVGEADLKRIFEK